MKWAVLLAVLLATQAIAADVGLNVYGLSYHPGRHDLNETNYGLGVRVRKDRGQYDLFADLGIYRDSGDDTARLLGGGALWHATEHIHLGGALTLFRSDYYNHGRAFIAPIPVAGWDAGRYMVNFTFMPRAGGNEIAVFGAWLTIWSR